MEEKNTILQERTPPVKKGELIICQITGKVRDPYVKYLGFMIFIKDVPIEISEEGIYLRIEITGVEKTYGFARFIEQV